MQLLEVNIDDVYPDENNPRKKFEGIDELAASFDLNAERPGEPFTPPILVQDGGIYRIVDGERRYRALKKRKATKFTANVCDGLDEANTLMAMLATDDKQPLDEMEKSRGVQQMLLLGVDPVKVERAAKIKDAKRIKRALSVVDDAAEDMSLDRLLAIEEFVDDPDVVELLMYCQEKDWRKLYEREVEDRKKQALIDELTDAIDAYMVPIYDDVPLNFVYEKRCYKADDITKFFIGVGDPKSYAAVINTYYPYVSICAPIGKRTEQVDPDQEQKDRLLAIADASRDRRIKWYGRKLHDSIVSGAKLYGETIQLILSYFKKTYFYSEIEDFDKIAETDIAALPISHAIAASSHKDAMVLDEINGFKVGEIVKGETRYYKANYEKYVEGFDANVADGYKPSDDELELIKKIRSVVKIDE